MRPIGSLCKNLDLKIEKIKWKNDYSFYDLKFFLCNTIKLML